MGGEHDEFLTFDEFRRSIRASRSKAYAILNSGQIETLKLGRKLLIPVSSAQRFKASLPRRRTLQ